MAVISYDNHHMENKERCCKSTCPYEQSNFIGNDGQTKQKGLLKVFVLIKFDMLYTPLFFPSKYPGRKVHKKL